MHDVGALPPSGFVRKGDNVTVTIGRNVGPDPLSANGWAGFQNNVRDAVRSLIRPEHVFTYYGQGEWDGVTEDSACIVFVNAGYTSSIARLDSELEHMAELFGQDAIGYSVGPGHLARR